MVLRSRCITLGEVSYIRGQQCRSKVYLCEHYVFDFQAPVVRWMEGLR